MSLLAAGAVLALVCGGAAGRLALGPLDAAYAKQQAIAADGAAPGPFIAAVTTQAAPSDGSDAAPPPIVPAGEEKAPIVRVSHASAASGRDLGERDGAGGRDPGAGDTAGYAEPAPPPPAFDERQDVPPYPPDATERPTADTPPWVDDPARAGPYPPNEPPPPEPY